MLLPMPSVPHEAMAELLRNNPKLGLALIFYMFPIPRGVEARMGDSNLSTVVPLLKELRGDAVVVLESDEQDFKRVVVIESQLSPPKPWKRRSLAAYTAVAGALHDCDSTLLVICYDPHTAEECRKTIRTGHPRFDVTPYVIFGHRTPDPFDPLLSFAVDELIVLSCFTKALDLDNPDIRDKVYEHLSLLDEQRRTTYIYFVKVAASEAARRALEERMAIDITDDPFIAGFVAQGEATGRADEARRILLGVLNAREIEISDSTRELVNACTDLIQLEQWTERAALAMSAGAVFGIRPQPPTRLTTKPTAAA
jgi:hypothetical protein